MPITLQGSIRWTHKCAARGSTALAAMDLGLIAGYTVNGKVVANAVSLP